LPYLIKASRDKYIIKVPGMKEYGVKFFNKNCKSFEKVLIGNKLIIWLN